MTFSLTVDAIAFRKHLVDTRERLEQHEATLTPVIKGNGYGFGKEILARECVLLGVSRIAIGTVWELETALSQFNGEVHVLEPLVASDYLAITQWQKLTAHHAQRIIATIASDDLLLAQSVGITNVILDAQTSLTRFGLSLHELIRVVADLPENLTIRGLSLHLPIVGPQIRQADLLEVSNNLRQEAPSSRVLEVSSWLMTYREIAAEHQLPLHVSLSHINEDDLARLHSHHPEFSIDVRMGTALWLGVRSALQAQGTVLAVHDVLAQQHVGYQQVASNKGQRLLVVSGGTAHGVALAAPTQRGTLRKKGIAVAESLNEILGKVRSPFSHRGKSLLFVEPPHMHVSLLWTQDDSIQVGDRLACNLRNTTANFDLVEGLA